MNAPQTPPLVRPRWFARCLLAAAAMTLFAICAVGLTVGGGAAAKPSPSGRPNVVVVMADDETVHALRFQRHVVREIGRRGATFTNNFVNYSLCCPSRATFLTGLYAHNHHVLNNSPPDGGFPAFERHDSRNDLPLWLQHAGYHTGAVGKYLNGYGSNGVPLVPPGWEEWYGLMGEITFYDYTLNENGRLVDFGSHRSDYVDDVITGNAVRFIDHNAPSQQPFFLYVAYHSPHGGPPHRPRSGCGIGDPEPPPRAFGGFATARLPKPPSFNEADVSDKPQAIQALAPLTPAELAGERQLYRCELESLQGIDDGVNAIVKSLRSAGELGNTLFVYTSDNGFLHGEHRIFDGKVYVYEPSIRVPLLMRGPGIPAGSRVRDLTINADLAPTIVRATGARAQRVMNGMPILSDTRHPKRELGRELLIEAKGAHAKNFFAIRTRRFKYVLYSNGERELYDLRHDPDEVQNVVDDPAYASVAALLGRELARLHKCRRGACRRLPKVETKLHYLRGHSPAGGPCSRGRATAELVGDDAALLTEVDFTTAGSSTSVTAAPFQLVIPRSELDPARSLRVRVRANLLDGRRLTLVAELPPRCGQRPPRGVPKAVR